MRGLPALDRKLVRDLMRFRGQALAISLVMACGVATFVMSLTTIRSLSGTLDGYYERYRFADVFAQVKRAPKSLSARLEEIPGVSRVETRVVQAVNLDVPGMSEPAIGRLISIPDHSEPALNALHLRLGRLPERGREDEAVVSEAFATAHGFRPGDRVRAVLNGRLQELTMVGVALSPEFVYQIPPGELLPDDRRYGVFWMRERALAQAFDMEGAFNDILVSLMPGANSRAVLSGIDALTERYGGLSAYGREDQLSNRFVQDELTQLRGMALVPPTIFLTVSAFLVNMVMSRHVRTQRAEIATLKAFGYSRFEVGLHYAKLVLLLSLVGLALGTTAGWWFGRSVTEMYTRFFRFPFLEYRAGLREVALAGLIAGGAALAGAIGSVLRAAALPPAEAMQPEPPPTYRRTIVERLGLERRFSPAVRMVLRRLERQPLRAAISSVGVAAGVAVLVLGAFVTDAVDHLIDFEYGVLQRQDITVTFFEPTSARAANEVARYPGVLASEPFRVVPVTISHGPVVRREAITGLLQGSSHMRKVDRSMRPIALPEDGVLLSEPLARALRVEPGDTVIVRALEGFRPERELTVRGLSGEYIGMSITMELGALNRMLREGGSVSGMTITADPARRRELYTRLKETPRVAGVLLRDAALIAMESTFRENIVTMRLFNTTFACIIAFGVVYNISRIALAERARELATLRVLGFDRGEISFILFAELAVITLVALPLGCLFGYGLASFVVTTLETETQRVPFVIRPATFAFAVGTVVIAAGLSALTVRGRLDRLDLVEVLKAGA